MKVELYGAEIGKDLGALRELLDPQWFSAWSACHKIGKNEQAARSSLSALCLLRRVGLMGELCYERGERPFLRNTSCDFSITHTDSYVYCAVLYHASSEPFRIGVDAETIGKRSLESLAPLAERWFSARERALLAVSCDEDTFLRIWTRKEAYVKVTGEGMRGLQGADTVEIDASGMYSFYEYHHANTCISLCIPAAATPPQEIDWHIL